MQTLASKLRQDIIHMITQAKEGHIPSSFSIVDLIYCVYAYLLRYDVQQPNWTERDYFILSKGHGCAALYAVLKHFGFLTEEDLTRYSQHSGRLGGHPDVTRVPGVEASTGSLGHGFPFGLGIALGLKTQKKNNRVIALLGDGECNEGTIWESALVASKQKLGNLLAIVDLNGSAAQILPVDPLREKWDAFGWETHEVNGHCEESIQKVFSSLQFDLNSKPKVIIAHTVKGKGVSFVEGHGKWHHRIPNEDEFIAIMAELS